MALFMDVHSIEGGVSASDVAAAHQADLAIQGAYGVNYRRYWGDLSEDWLLIPDDTGISSTSDGAGRGVGPSVSSSHHKIAHR
jgi:hypothetical protein